MLFFFGISLRSPPVFMQDHFIKPDFCSYHYHKLQENKKDFARESKRLKRI